MTTGHRLGIDIGGTFTDFVLVDGAGGGVLAAKVLTTPQAPEQAVFRGIAALEAQRPGFAAQAGGVIHATTLITNAILTRRGARAGAGGWTGPGAVAGSRCARCRAPVPRRRRGGGGGLPAARLRQPGP